MQNVVTIDTLDPNQKQVVFNQSAWFNLRKIGDTQYRFIRLEVAPNSTRPTAPTPTKAAQSGCGCGKKK